MSSAQQTPQARAERWIAAGRVGLAGSSLFAVWLDPSEPAKHAETAYALLAAYLVYAGVVAWVAWRAAAPAGAAPLLSHAFDLGFFTLFIYFTSGPSSPFTPFFVFSLVCAALRWQWRGTLWTAVVALAAYLGMSVYFAEFVEDPQLHPHRLIIRGVYLAVVAVLLGYLGAYGHREVAATEERIRLARDLHDGVLQSLTGIALRLAAVRRLVDEDPAAAVGRLEEAQRLMLREQRDLRFFIRELKPLEPTDGTLETRLRALSRRLEDDWGLRVELDLGTLPRWVREPLAGGVYDVVREALVNAARHGEAAVARVEIRAAAGRRLAVTVSDDGCGFPFEGTYSLAELATAGQGPKTLCERVAALQGGLELVTGPGGARLEILLPQRVL